MKYIILF